MRVGDISIASPQKRQFNNQLNITDDTFIRENQNINQTIIHQSPQKSKCLGFIFDFAKLYSFADMRQKWIIIIGLLLGLLSGTSYPLFIYVWCSQIELTMKYHDHLLQKLGQFQSYLYIFIAMGIGVLIFNGLVFMIWKYISRSISKKIRIKYLQAFIKNPIQELEKKNGYEWANDFKIHTLNIEKSIGDKVALLLNLFGIMISGIIAAFGIRWTLTLYMFALFPIGIVIIVYFMKIQIQKKAIKTQSNRKAQQKALQATAMIKTIKMLNGQEKELNEYVARLSIGEDDLSTFNIHLGMSTALFYFIQSIFVAGGFLMGIQCVRGSSFCPQSITGSKYKVSELLIVFYQMFFCSYNFLQLGSNYNIIKSAIESSQYIFDFIEKSENFVRLRNPQNKPPEHIGRISFHKVVFSYPLNPDKTILKGLNLEIEEFGFNALAGTTGSGKSTALQLLLKQYEPQSGQIRIGDKRLDEIDTGAWLDCVGVVSQEPVLFEGSIRENVLVGKQDATEDEIEEALKLANIYEFASQQPKGLDFQIGVGGSKLSGGQKQRIAIARALIKKPKLLLLDEATSALDPRTERQIQETFESIRKNLNGKMTIICIAHRMQTIANSDKIFLLRNGQVERSGKFHEIQQLHRAQSCIQIERQISRIVKKKKNNNISQIEQTLTFMGNRLSQIARRSNIYLQKMQGAIKRQLKQVYSYLFSYTDRKVWYIVCILLAILIGIIHCSSGLLLAYSLEQQNKLYYFGIAMSWCLNSPPMGTNQCNSTLDFYLQQAQKYLYGLFGYAVITFIPYLIQTTMLSKIENEIAFKMRRTLYKRLLSLEVSYFQRPENDSGAAATRFGNDTREACSLLTSYVPILVSNFTTVIGAVVICFIYDWRYGFLSMLVTPLIALAFYIAMLFIAGYEDGSLQATQRADQIANELIVSIKTVQVLNYQERLLEKYKQSAEEPLFQVLGVGVKIGALYGSALLILEFVTGLALYLSVVISSKDPSITSLSINVFMIVSILSGFTTGNNFYFIAHIALAKQAAARVMDLVNSPTEEEVQNLKQFEKVNVNPQTIRGELEFKDVSFRYTSQSDDEPPILNKVSLKIRPGEKVAFVGSSGCGKSTLMQLLLRFYDFEGQIFLDGVNIYRYSLRQYRSIFAMLNQQPSLFAGTVKQNMLYNLTIDEKKLHQACVQACAHAPKPMNLQQEVKIFQAKVVGPKGSNISGGEKQRVACVRALIRDTKVFLMDEGTSALDRATEKEVQNSLDGKYKKQGKTMVIIAHRLKTVENANQVFVFDKGQLKQFGSMKELYENKSYFYELYEAQKDQS